ncbi:MAG: homoserine kinase, partial [Thermoflexales bacterium]|nr:homoserine kinase [Thermoflexales bacterium]
GFDSMGLALDLWNTFSLYEGDGQGITVESHGEGEDSLPTDGSHLVARTMLDEIATYLPINTRTVAYHIVCHNAVPCASGMGSSSTAVLAGLVFAHAVLDPHNVQHPSTQRRILTRAFELEGHGDNVAPAMLGGLVLVAGGSEEVITQRILPPPMRVVVCVPEFYFTTAHARATLPTHYSRSDAVFNIGRAMLVAEALRTGDLRLLARAFEDRLHEPYRLPAIPGAVEARREALAHGAAAVGLSGAGPGLIAFTAENHDEIGRAMQSAFGGAGLRARYWVLNVSERGLEIAEPPAPSTAADTAAGHEH